MKTYYDNAVQVLINRGWTKQNPASFVKGDYEIFFDTSNYIEVIKISTKECLYENHLDSGDIVTYILNNLLAQQQT